MEATTDMPRPEQESIAETIAIQENVHTSECIIGTQDKNEVTPDETPETQSESFYGLDKDTETQVTDLEEEEEVEIIQTSAPSNDGIRQKAQFVFDPSKLNIRFLFANHDGLDVTVICNPSDTVGQLKGQLLSLWPNEISQGLGITGDQLRLVCMGKGVLGPDLKTLSECGVPIFETHATPVNVSVRPILSKVEDSSGLKKTELNSRTDPRVSPPTSTDACCVIL